MFLQADQSIAQGPRRLALLIGINDYSGNDSSAGEGRARWDNLQGAVNDIESMRDMLMARYGFSAENVLLLKDQEASREAILESIQKHLINPSRVGDVIVFHFSGHGSQVRNSKSKEIDQLDESIVPADSILGRPDIRDKELRRLFNRLLDKGVRLTVILDSCHSGSGVRGLMDGSQIRSIPADLQDVADPKPDGPPIETRGALVFSAAQDFESAAEVLQEGRYHGAFTLALLKAMRAASPNEPSHHLFERARGWLGASGRYQRPVMEGLSSRLDEPLFGPSEGNKTRPLVAIGSVDSEEQIRLLGGWIDGLASGSRLRRFPAKPGGEEVSLQVTRLEGLQHSFARVVKSTDSAADLTVVQPGQLFDIVSWVAEQEPLKVWIPRTQNLEKVLQFSQGLGGDLEGQGIAWVADPTEETPSAVLRWDGARFRLLDPNCPRMAAGERWGTADQFGCLSGGKSVFLEIPAPETLVAALGIGADGVHSAIEVVADPSQATYILAGRLQDQQLEYAWIRPGSLQTDQEETSLPIRSTWIPFEPSKQQDPHGSGWELRDRLLRLYKVFAWNLLQPVDGEARAAFPYRLEIVGPQGEILERRDLLSGIDYTAALVAKNGASLDRQAVEDRFVYVFGIDSHGASSLVYPQGSRSSENIFPGTLNEGAEAPQRIELGEISTFSVAEPFGLVTLFMYSATEPLSSPALIFEYEGVRSQKPTSWSSLETLLVEVGSTERGSLIATPSNWSIEKTRFRSVDVREP